ncbi:MAG: phosphoglycerate kinase [Dehalococcoidales bacterium]|nr:MAG: phosphoglycerate kinase [Dehalococcoidales bacterium]
MNKKTIKDIDVSGKKILVRVDFNVNLDEKTGEITDDSRIRAALPTINYLIEKKAKIILCSHRGRPDGKVVENLRLRVVAERLSKLVGEPVISTLDCIGPEAEIEADGLDDGELLLLENLRFHPEEEENDPVFAAALAKLADIYVDDAFGTAHRTHASIDGVTKFLPAVAGLLMEKELEYLGGILENPVKPFGGLVGGAKVSDKVTMLENIMNKVDFILIGGGMAATFLKTKSYEVGLSLVEEDRIETARDLIEQAGKAGVRLVLPTDVMVSEEIKAGSPREIVSVDKIPSDKKIVDIGYRTIELFTNELQRAGTVFWNGPMGINEIPDFAAGTHAMALLLSSLDADTIIGGGSTADVVINMGLADKMTFISTGGGASLRFLGGKKLPGVEALLDK